MAMQVDLKKVREQLERQKLQVDAAIRREQLTVIRATVAQARRTQFCFKPKTHRLIQELETLVVYRPYETRAIDERIDDLLESEVIFNPH